MMFTVFFHHVTQQSENTLRMYFGLNFAHRRERTHRKVAPTRKREREREREREKKKILACAKPSRDMQLQIMLH